MNFLAHAHLSPSNDLILLGNFFGDSFKGKAENHQPKNLANGIKLHRAIDHYTDSHPLVLKAVSVFRPQQKRMAAIVVDMVFDHLLATTFHQWSAVSLKDYSSNIFSRLNNNTEHIPQRAHQFYAHMRKHNWLLAYQQTQGLQQALEGMDRRFKGESCMAQSISVLQDNRSELNDIFSAFYSELNAFVKDRET